MATLPEDDFFLLLNEDEAPDPDLYDPHPDIHALFMLYNSIYFADRLGFCSVEWSTKAMTLCAGVCHFQRGGGCRIKLSEPLLKLRPVSDLKNTLLHEMIHAELFLEGIRDRGDHGPKFQTRMNAINSASLADPQRPRGGYHITVYHTMHDEVNFYRRHWWQCNRCQNIVKRAMNRPPQEADCRGRSGRGAACADTQCLFHMHIKHCGGEYIKIKSPEKEEAKAGSKAKQASGKAGAGSSGVAAAVAGGGSPQQEGLPVKRRRGPGSNATAAGVVDGTSGRGPSSGGSSSRQLITNFFQPNATTDAGMDAPNEPAISQAPGANRSWQAQLAAVAGPSGSAPPPAFSTSAANTGSSGRSNSISAVGNASSSSSSAVGSLVSISAGGLSSEELRARCREAALGRLLGRPQATPLTAPPSQQPSMTPAEHSARSLPQQSAPVPPPSPYAATATGPASSVGPALEPGPGGHGALRNTSTGPMRAAGSADAAGNADTGRMPHHTSQATGPTVPRASPVLGSAHIDLTACPSPAQGMHHAPAGITHSTQQQQQQQHNHDQQQDQQQQPASSRPGEPLVRPGRSLPPRHLTVGSVLQGALTHAASGTQQQASSHAPSAAVTPAAAAAAAAAAAQPIEVRVQAAVLDQAPAAGERAQSHVKREDTGGIETIDLLSDSDEGGGETGCSIP